MKNYSFFDLQKLYKIIIPQIQRDYAQGREDKNNDNKIKSYDFIIKIIKVLTDDESELNLDFVYGYTEKIAGEQSAFIPLDGQQRLTTLWLLHWYLAPKKEKEQNGIKMIAIEDDVKKWLKKFTYETRTSSERFCEKLIEEYLPVSDNIRAAIEDANWFMTSWQKDPTVISILKMLETIQSQNFDKEKAWKNLIENRKITFDYIDIESDEFKLTDELYIKMNSRGRPLTSFENFKAKFSEILSSKDTDFVDEKPFCFEGKELTFEKYFAFKIDSFWTDLFWSFVMQNENEIQKKMDENTKIEKNETPISYIFMNFFVYVAQMCYFKDNIDKMVSDFKNDFSIFQKKDNALFLFKTLDFFHEISLDESKQVKIENINTFFNKLFQTGMIDDSYHGQVRLFDDSGVNLFEKCLLEGSNFENRNRIILYCLVSYIIEYNLKEVNINLLYYIRVIRNLLQATRQRKETVYNTDVRINYFGNYWKLFNQIQEKPKVYERLLEGIDNKLTKVTDNALNNEKEKAEIIVNNTSNQAIIQALFRLEEFEHFKGLIHQLKPKENVSKLINYSKAVNEIWTKENDNLVIAALIACDFNGLYIKYCNFYKWKTILFGKHNTILTCEDNKISFSILKLLDIYLSLTNDTAGKKLEKIIYDKLNSLTTSNDWRYYFLKYYEKMFKNSSYFAWENDFVIESLRSESSNPLVASHINPYVTTVSLLLDSGICEEKECWGIYSNVSKIVLKNKFELFCENDGWHIKVPKGQTVPDKLIKKYDINEQNIFSETNEKDRIMIAVEFCNDLCS